MNIQFKSTSFLKSRARILLVYSFFSFALTVTTSGALAASAGSTRFVPLQEQAQGQSLVGANLLNDSLFSNPASSSFINVYSVDATFLGPRNFSASVLDTRTSQVGGALGYSRQPSGVGDLLAQTAQAAMMVRALPYLGFGLGGHMLWAPDTDGVQKRHTDLDLGMILSMDPIQVGVTTRSIMGGDASMGEYRQTVVGARIHYDQMMFLSVAVQTAPNSVTPEQYGIGTEYISPYRFALKGGYRIRPQENRSYWSAGFSVLSPKLSLHYAAVFPSVPSESVQHMVGATALF